MAAGDGHRGTGKTFAQWWGCPCYSFTDQGALYSEVSKKFGGSFVHPIITDNEITFDEAIYLLITLRYIRYACWNEERLSFIKK